MDLLLIAIVLFVAGVLLGIAEIFIPSAGVLAVLSIGSFAGSIVCAFKVSAGCGIGFLLAAPVVMLVAVIRGFKVFPRTPFGRRMILRRPEEQDQARAVDAAGFAEAVENNPGLVGRAGVALTDLRPAGAAEIAGRRHDVVSEGEFIRAGAPVRVVAMQGNRIVVEPVTE